MEKHPLQIQLMHALKMAFKYLLTGMHRVDVGVEVRNLNFSQISFFMFQFLFVSDAFTCNNNIPWALNDNLSYGFAAAHVKGKKEADLCCKCYQLTFTSGPVHGKKMIVQVTNTGDDLGVSSSLHYIENKKNNF